MTRRRAGNGRSRRQIEQNETERTALAQSVAELEQEMQEVRTGLLEKNQARDADSGARPRGREDHRSVALRDPAPARRSVHHPQPDRAGRHLSRRNRARTDARAEGRRSRRGRNRASRGRQAAAFRTHRAAPAGNAERDHGPPRDGRRPRRRSAKRRPNCVSRSTSFAPNVRACARKRESLENILSHHSYTTESTKKLLAALENGRAGQFRPEGVLADFIEVDPAWERAAEEFLHDELEYVVVKDWTQAEQSMNLLRGELEGRATFLVEGGPVADEPATAQGLDLPRLVRPDQLHQRPLRPDAQSPAAAFRLLSRERSRSGPRHGGRVSRPLLPARRRPVLQRPHADRRTQESQRTAGPQARNARVRGAI